MKETEPVSPTNILDTFKADVERILKNRSTVPPEDPDSLEAVLYEGPERIAETLQELGRVALKVQALVRAGEPNDEIAAAVRDFSETLHVSRMAVVGFKFLSTPPVVFSDAVIKAIPPSFWETPG